MRHIILLVTYNGERNLPEQLKSIEVAARGKDVLIAHFDDCSSDRTIAVVDALPENIKTERFIFKKTGSVSLNFIKLMRLALERYGDEDLFYFCDQDDIWAPNKLTVCESIYKSEGYDLLLSNTEMFGIRKGIIKPNIMRPFWKDLAFNVCPGMSMCFAPKRIGHLLQQLDRFRWHDHGLFILLKSNAASIKYTPNTLQYYRRHANAFTEVNALGLVGRFIYFVNNALTLLTCKIIVAVS